MNSRSCIVCGSSLIAAHWNATTCSEACKVERRRRYKSRYQSGNRDQCRAYWRKYSAKPKVKERKLRHARLRREADPIKARERDKEKRLRSIERIRRYDRQWKSRYRSANPELARQAQRDWWGRMAAALLAVQEITGAQPQKKLGARRKGPVKPIPKADIVAARIRARECVCCGSNISARPKRVTVCSNLECRREIARRRATEYRWKNIDASREKERARSNAKRGAKRQEYLAKWREVRREHLIAQSRSRYRENGDLIRAQQYDRYLQLRAAFLALNEINPEITDETRTPA